MTALTNVTQTGANNGALVLAAQNSRSDTDASDSKPDTTINGLPREILELVFSWLDPKSVARADQVCKYWRGIISDPFQSLWKQMRSVGPFSGVMIPITIERPIPQEFDYRANVASTWPLEGELRLFTDDYINIKEKTRNERNSFSPLRWGRDEAEPFLPIIISNEESKEEFRRSGDEPGPWLRGPSCSWQNSYSKLPGGFFSEHLLPLRFFYKKDGSIVNNGDKILLKYQGKVVILTFQNSYWLTGYDQISFPEQVTDRINVAISINRLTQEQVNEAIRLAQIETRAVITSE